MKKTRGSTLNFKNLWKKLLRIFEQPEFRIGGGTRRGFGKVSVVGLKERCYDLRKPDELLNYISQEAEITLPTIENRIQKMEKPFGWVSYTLELIPESWYLFGSGKSDEESDMTPVKEAWVSWDINGKPSIQASIFIAPGSSLKGALAHRTAYRYNQIKRIYSDECLNISDNVGEKNKAVKDIFGTAKAFSIGSGIRGRILIDDIMIGEAPLFIIPHIMIDRFTQGPMDGALFFESVIKTDNPLCTTIYIREDALEDKDVEVAFESALSDLVKGYLPIGGGVMRGNGVFTGSWKKNMEENRE